MSIAIHSTGLATPHFQYLYQVNRNVRVKTDDFLEMEIIQQVRNKMIIINDSSNPIHFQFFSTDRTDTVRFAVFYLEDNFDQLPVSSL